MKHIILFAILILSLTSAYGQITVKQDTNGNYTQVKDTSKARGTTAKPTGRTFTDSKGNVYPVLISKNGKLFVIRTSKTGNKYNQYLKL